MSLNDITKEYGIHLRDEDGNLRNVVDVMEDLYLRLSPYEFASMMQSVSEEEKRADLFDNERGHKYGGQ